MTDFLRTLQDDLEVQARTTGHQVYLRLADDLPACSIDRAAVSRAISNLISNAIKYSDKDQPIALTAQRRDGYVSITVRDRGVGIPASEVPRVFDRFYRAQRTNGDHVQGTGLGLTIVRETMERHGGQVRLESKEGEGTIVELLIPTA
jgi:signal transduction histidine kinase